MTHLRWTKKAWVSIPVILLIISLSVVLWRGLTKSAGAGTVTLRWEAPTTRADGRPLDSLAGYKVHYGLSSRRYTEVVGLSLDKVSCNANEGVTVCSYTLTGLPSGTYYFAVTAYDSNGNQSVLSNERSKRIP